MNSSFDHNLRNALRRVEPSDGFAQRVMSRLPEKHPRSRYWLGAIAAAVALLATFAGIDQHRREHRMQAEQTQREVVFALSLASEKLDHAMNRANSRLQRSAPDVTIGLEARGRL